MKCAWKVNVFKFNHQKYMVRYENKVSKYMIVCDRMSMYILCYTSIYKDIRIFLRRGLNIGFFTFDGRIRCKVHGR